jgi:hypothetical protein
MPLLLSIDPAKRSGWSLIDIKSKKVVNYGLIDRKYITIEPTLYIHNQALFVTSIMNKVVNYGLIVCKNILQFDQDIENLLLKYQPAIDQFLIEEPTFKGYNLKSYATLHDIFFLWKLNILKFCGNAKLNTITIQELNRFCHGFKRKIKKDYVKQYVNQKFGLAITDDNITDSIYNADLWLNKGDWLLRLREHKKERKRFISKVKRDRKLAEDAGAL